MKSRLLLVLVPAAMILAACNFTLAADVTPPPDYVPPTPMPTLGPLFPASAPDLHDGAVIFAENCVPCHGERGLGDGPQSMQLPVTVPGIGLPEVARSAKPADWFKIVSQGNLDRFMPPFGGSLSDQQRWDVVAYALSLHTTQEELQRGKALVQTGCANCGTEFQNQNLMASLSEQDIVDLIKAGGPQVAAFARDYADEDAFAAAAYLRTLSFSGLPEVAQATPVIGTAQAIPATPGAATTQESSSASTQGVGTVTGRIDFPPAANPADLTVTLHGFDHGADASTGPQEVLTVSHELAPDGSYVFEDVGLPANRIFLAEVQYRGISYRSDFAAATGSESTIAVPDLRLYEPSEDTSLLRVDQIHIYTDFATPGTVQVLEIFAFTNSSENAIVISTDGTTIPFIRLPDGALNTGYEAGQDSAAFVAADKGLAVVPSAKPYSIIAFFNLPYQDKLEIKQPLAIDSPSILLLVPDGIRVDGAQLASMGPQVIQNNNYQEFAARDLKAGDTLSFTLGGQPRTAASAAVTTQRGWLIGAGALGLALIVGGALLYVRDRRRQLEAPQEEEFDSQDDVLDAILALDDLHRAGKISDEAYEARRAELKAMLRQLG